MRSKVHGGWGSYQAHCTGQTNLCKQTRLLTPKPYSSAKRRNGGAWARVRVRTLPICLLMLMNYDDEEEPGTDGTKEFIPKWGSMA